MLCLRRPTLFSLIFKKLNVLNFSFLTLPNTACDTPHTSFYSTFNGITIGVAGLLVFVGAVWACGTVAMRLKGWSPAAVIKYHRWMISRFITILTLTYAPVTEEVLSIFGCRKIGEALTLREDTGFECTTDEYYYHRRVGFFWVVFYVAGVPLLYLALLNYYNIPQVAAELKRNACLRTLLDHAHNLRVAQDDATLATAATTTANIDAAHLDALYVAFIAKEDKEDDRSPIDVAVDSVPEKPVTEDASSAAHSHPVLGRSAPAEKLRALIRWSFGTRREVHTLTREEKLTALVSFSSQHLVTRVVTWHSSKGDPRLEGAEAAIGTLYEGATLVCTLRRSRQPYLTRRPLCAAPRLRILCGQVVRRPVLQRVMSALSDKSIRYWMLIETLNKLLITGVLGFVRCVCCAHRRARSLLHVVHSARLCCAAPAPRRRCLQAWRSLLACCCTTSGRFRTPRRPTCTSAMPPPSCSSSSCCLRSACVALPRAYARSA